MRVTKEIIGQFEELEEELLNRRSVNEYAADSRITLLAADDLRELDQKLIWLRSEKNYIEKALEVMSDLMANLKNLAVLQTRIEILDKARENPLLEKEDVA